MRPGPIQTDWMQNHWTHHRGESVGELCVRVCVCVHLCKVWSYTIWLCNVHIVMSTYMICTHSDSTSGSVEHARCAWTHSTRILYGIRTQHIRRKTNTCSHIHVCLPYMCISVNSLTTSHMVVNSRNSFFW